MKKSEVHHSLFFCDLKTSKTTLKTCCDVREAPGNKQHFLPTPLRNAVKKMICQLPEGIDVFQFHYSAYMQHASQWKWIHLYRLFMIFVQNIIQGGNNIL